MPHWLLGLLIAPLAFVGILIWAPHTYHWWFGRGYRPAETPWVRFTTVVLQVLIFAGPVALFTPYDLGWSTETHWPLQVTGIIIYHFGIGLAIWAKMIMGGSWGPPATRPRATDRDVRLITHGPFRYTRNPIYFGLWLGITGAYSAFESWLAAPAFSIVFLFPKLLETEERIMEETFGDLYRVWARRTSRWWPWPPRLTPVGKHGGTTLAA